MTRESTLGQLVSSYLVSAGAAVAFGALILWAAGSDYFWLGCFVNWGVCSAIWAAVLAFRGARRRDSKADPQ